MRGGVSALLSFGCILLITQRRRLRISLGDRIRRPSGSAQQRVGERRGGKTDGGQFDEAAAAVVRGVTRHDGSLEVIVKDWETRANTSHASAGIIPRAAKRRLDLRPG